MGLGVTKDPGYMGTTAPQGPPALFAEKEFQINLEEVATAQKYCFLFPLRVIL